MEQNKAAWDISKEGVGARSDDPDYESKWWAWTKRNPVFATTWELEEEFKDSKKIYNYFVKLGIYDEVMELWSTRGIFSAEGLNHRTVISNLRSLVTMFRTVFEPTIGRDMAAAAVMSAIHFMTPLSPPNGNQTAAGGGQVAPWVFNRSAGDGQTEKMLNLLKTDMKDSASFKKLGSMKDAIPGKADEFQVAAEQAEEEARRAANAMRGSKDKKLQKAAAKAKAAALKARAKATEKKQLPIELKGWAPTVSVKTGRGGPTSSRGTTILEDQCFTLTAVLGGKDNDGRRRQQTDGAGQLQQFQHLKLLKAMSFNMFYKFMWLPPVEYRGKQLGKCPCGPRSPLFSASSTPPPSSHLLLLLLDS